MTLHRYRVAMVRADRTKLTGDVEVDETFVGGVNPGKSGRGSGKSIVAVAVELKNPRGYGRCRLQVIPDASGPDLHGFISDHVEVGSACSIVPPSVSADRAAPQPAPEWLQACDRVG